MNFRVNYLIIPFFPPALKKNLKSKVKMRIGAAKGCRASESSHGS